ncbi:MAG: isoprenylcysteine carboxylmethyltransferase family protein [Flavobacteriales bacterium]|nr:isoprenylcysteine carboxylmethyltransferase family protein [Flavobacteriales bacterium]
MLTLGLTTLLFYALHSLLAWTGVKQWAARRLGLARWYRLAYSLLSTLLALAVVLAYMDTPRPHLWQASVASTVIGFALLITGALLASAAILRFGGAGFIGLVPEPEGELVRSGLHAQVRHPIYSGIILSCIGWLLLAPNAATLLVVGITFLYLPVGIHLEEHKLIARFGYAYRTYKREVPSVMPRLKKR